MGGASYVLMQIKLIFLFCTLSGWRRLFIFLELRAIVGVGLFEEIDKQPEIAREKRTPEDGSEAGAIAQGKPSRLEKVKV